MFKSRAVWVIAAVLSLGGISAAVEMVGGKHISPQLGKLEEMDATSQLGEPNYGYVGELGSFEATTRDDAEAMMVVHNYPDTSKYAARFDKAGVRRAKAAGECRRLGVQDAMGWRSLSVAHLLQLGRGLLWRRRIGLHRQRLSREHRLGLEAAAASSHAIVGAGLQLPIVRTKFENVTSHVPPRPTSAGSTRRPGLVEGSAADDLSLPTSRHHDRLAGRCRFSRQSTVRGLTVRASTDTVAVETRRRRSTVQPNVTMLPPAVVSFSRPLIDKGGSPYYGGKVGRQLGDNDLLFDRACPA